MIQGRFAVLGGVLALAALVAAGPASAQADSGPVFTEPAPWAAASVNGLSQIFDDAWLLGTANMRGPAGRSFGDPYRDGPDGPGGVAPPPSVLHDMPLSRTDRGLQAPPVARYAAGQGEVFVFDRSSGAALLKFDNSPEIWVLQPSPAPRGDVIYRNDLGEPVLRATRLGGLTLFSANTPGGEAAALMGGADDLQPPPFLPPGAVFQRMLQSSARASRAAQHLIRFDAPDVTPEFRPRVRGRRRGGVRSGDRPVAARRRPRLSSAADQDAVPARRHRPGRAGPEAGARHLVRIGLARHGVGQMRHAAGVARRPSAGKARHRQIERAPEKMHRARLCRGRRCGNAPSPGARL